MPNIYLGAQLDWSKWIYGLVAAAIGGGAGAVTAGGAAAWVIPNVKMQQALEVMAATFVVSGVFNMMNFLAKEPLPPSVTTTTIQQTTTQGIVPKTVTEVTQTKVEPQPTESKPKE